MIQETQAQLDKCITLLAQALATIETIITNRSKTPWMEKQWIEGILTIPLTPINLTPQQAPSYNL
jgi:hypothetical protein